MSGFIMQFCRDWPRKEMISTPFGSFLLGAPTGYCPWGETRCGDDCYWEHGCRVPPSKTEGLDEASGLMLELLGRGPHGFYATGQDDAPSESDGS